MPSNNREVWLRARRKYMENHPDRVKEQRTKQNKKYKENGYFKNWQLQRKYKMSLAEFNGILAAQGNVCKACGTTTPGNRGWCTDHNHSNGKVRGILCTNCNLSLAFAKDNINILRGLITYLENSP